MFRVEYKFGTWLIPIRNLKFYLMRTKFYLLSFFVGILISFSAFSQTISYINAPLAEVCNTFKAGTTPSKVNGYEHYPVSGGVLYNHTDSAISLKGQTASANGVNTYKGTAYAIKYPFKEGYAYNIKVVAWQLDPAKGVSRLDFGLINQLPDPNDSDPVSCGPVSQDKWAVLQGNIVAGTNLDNSKSVRTLGSFTADQAYTYLTVLIWQGSTEGSWAFIRSITITEMPPSYTLSPASITKACGTPLSQTFTITDVHNSGKVSSYVWDLGSATNGWFYKGAPAQQLITTTTPALDLTADGCTTPSNVTATVTRPSGIYTTNQSVMSFSLPSVTLTGPSQMCDVATFTVDGLPCGATVNWRLAPIGNGTLSTTTGATTTLTRTGNDRHFVVTADITSSCGNISLGKLVQVVGQPAPFVITSPEIPCQSGRVVPVVTFNASPVTTGATYNWSWGSSDGTGGFFTSHSSSVSRKFGLGSHIVTASAINACGETDEVSFQFNILSCQSIASEQAKVSVSPNPASNIVTVTTADIKQSVQGKEKIREVRIIDKTGKLLRRQLFPAGTTMATINVEHFKPDIYMLQIGNGKTFQTRKITISR